MNNLDKVDVPIGKGMGMPAKLVGVGGKGGEVVGQLLAAVDRAEGPVDNRGADAVQPAGNKLVTMATGAQKPPPSVLVPGGGEGTSTQLLGVEAVGALLGTVLANGESIRDAGVSRGKLVAEARLVDKLKRDASGG